MSETQTATAKIKISDWLSERDGHTIYDSKGLGAKFKELTGYDPAWPEHSQAATVQAIKARGLGGELDSNPENKALAYGWEIAEGLASRYAPGVEISPKFGRGSRFRAAVEALRKAGM